MRKLVSISFLVIFLVYHVGYLGYYWISENQIKEKWLDRYEYEGFTKEISIPIELPYWTDQAEYQHTDGKLTWEGKIYRKVKQKYSKGALHLILVEDKLTQELNQSVSEWIKTVTTDSQQESSSGKSNLKSVVKDYTHISVEFAYQQDFSLITKTFYSYNEGLLKFSADVITPPPQPLA